MSERIDNFLLAEYAALREEVKWNLGQMEKLEYTALIFSGAIWTWISQPQTPLKKAVVFLPLVSGRVCRESKSTDQKMRRAL